MRAGSADRAGLAQPTPRMRSKYEVVAMQVCGGDTQENDAVPAPEIDHGVGADLVDYPVALHLSEAGRG